MTDSSRPGATAPLTLPVLLAYGALALSMSLVGSYVALSKLLVAVFPVLLLAWLRFVIAVVAMAGWLRRRPGEAALGSSDRRLLFLQAFFGNFLFSICMLYGIALSSALAAGVVMSAMPAVVGVMSWLFLGERIGPRLALAIVSAAGGIALLSAVPAANAPFGSDTGDTTASWGHLLLFCAVCCEASYVVIGKRLTRTVSARRISAIINLWGCALMTPFGIHYALRFDFTAVSPELWLLVVFYALAASMIAVWLWMTGLKRAPAASAGVFTVMLPVAAATVGVALLGESFTTVHAASFALALCAIMLATWPSRQPSAIALPR